MPEQDREISRRAFWSGTITFGLVSIPVSLFPGKRSSRASLRMLAPDGTPLRRQYYCPEEGRPVKQNEIVRGYEIEKDRYVIVTDEELEALEPKKTREIDLRRFVPVEQIDRKFFDRPYFLVPAGQTTKPYRLLAQTMEKSGRAGIATFVMRTKEYLVAILSENGILRAETLRFADQIRTPDDVGLPQPREVSEELLQAVKKEIREKSRKDLDRNELKDRYSEKLRTLAEKKQSAHEDLAQAPAEEEYPEEDQGKVVDIMDLLRKSLERGGPERKTKTVQEDRTGFENLKGKSKSELYARARELDIPGRSSMSREELVEAIAGSREKEEA